MPANSKDSLYSELKRTNHLLKSFTSTKQSFFRGIISGLGASLGATLVIGIILWLFAQLEFLPVIGTTIKPFTEMIKNAIPSGRP